MTASGIDVLHNKLASCYSKKPKFVPTTASKICDPFKYYVRTTFGNTYQSNVYKIIT